MTARVMIVTSVKGIHLFSIVGLTFLAIGLCLPSIATHGILSNIEKPPAIWPGIFVLLLSPTGIGLCFIGVGEAALQGSWWCVMGISTILLLWGNIALLRRKAIRKFFFRLPYLTVLIPAVFLIQDNTGEPSLLIGYYFWGAAYLCLAASIVLHDRLLNAQRSA